MAAMNDVTASRPEAVGADLRRTARTTGLLYLGLIVIGVREHDPGAGEAT